jgi:hypothetical protein
MWSANATNNFFILQTSLHVSAPTGHLQVITIVMTFNMCCFEDSHSTAIHPFELNLNRKRHLINFSKPLKPATNSNQGSTDSKELNFKNSSTA